jgi:hypothetical protein
MAVGSHAQSSHGENCLNLIFDQEFSVDAPLVNEVVHIECFVSIKTD